MCNCPLYPAYLYGLLIQPIVQIFPQYVLSAYDFITKKIEGIRDDIHPWRLYQVQPKTVHIGRTVEVYIYFPFICRHILERKLTHGNLDWIIPCKRVSDGKVGDIHN